MGYYIMDGLIADFHAKTYTSKQLNDALSKLLIVNIYAPAWEEC